MNRSSRFSSEWLKFEALFSQLVDDLTYDGLQSDEVRDAFRWFEQAIRYNVPTGKKTRGFSVVTSLIHLMPDVTESDLQIARVLGWCVELMKMSFIINDDLMDNSTTRRNQESWHAKKNVKMIAVNDASFIDACSLKLINLYLSTKPYYCQILELFHETKWDTCAGQCLGMTTDFPQFSMERYKSIAVSKSAFALPVQAAMYMAGISDQATHSQVKEILLEIGNIYQIKNDYYDCYGDPVTCGKCGSDIEENKCSWFIAKALEVASDEQREQLKVSYGKYDPEAVKKVKSIYKDLNLEERYKDFQESNYKVITERIKSLNVSISKYVFQDYLDILFEREL